MMSRSSTLLFALQLIHLSLQHSIQQDEVENGRKRNIFGGSSSSDDICKKCYDCWCSLHCDWSALACPYVFKDADCHARYHQDGGWSEWSKWSQCEGGCGGHGSRRRNRSCTNPVKHNCGKDCEGQGEHVDATCQTQPCPTAAPTTTPTQPTTQPTTQTSTTQPTTQMSTTQSTTQRSTASPTTQLTSTPSTLQPTVSTELTKPTYCSKLRSVTAVAQNRSFIHPEATRCGDGSHTGSEALVVDCCSSTSTSQWRQGENVVQACGTSSIPDYTAVAVFTNGYYVTGTSGIFVGCLSGNETGFRFIQQSCGNTPYIYHVNTVQTKYPSPTLYYVINQ